jgi:gluconate 2-dehydrogenase gamma chain
MGIQDHRGLGGGEASEVPPTPTSPPPTDMLRFFSADEARTVDAITARIMPGDPSDPGAHEAGVVTYIDNALAFGNGFDEPTYMEPPFAKEYEGDTPPADSNGYQVVYVKKDELGRYGFQSQLTHRETYRMGLKALDAYAQSKGGQNFADLPPDQQDAVLTDMENDQASSFDDKPKASDFFKLLQKHTIEGMFADPVYGGNRNSAGWKLVGYPGAMRAYTWRDLKDESTPFGPQSIDDLAPFHPGQGAGQHELLPVSGPQTQSGH